MNITQLKALLAKLEKGTKEYNEVSEQIAKLEQEQLDTKASKKEAAPEVIPEAAYAELLRLAPKSVTKHDLSREEAAKYMIQNGNDVKKAAKAYLNHEWEKQIKDVPSYDKFDKNSKLHKTITEMVGDALTNLPDARILVQDIMTRHGTSVYDQVIATLMPRVETIYAGSGKDITEEYLPSVKVFDGDLVPSAQDKAKFRPENFTSNWAVELGDTIYQSAIIVTEGDYIKYFLNGKVDEYIEKAISGIAAAIRVKQYIDCMALVKNIYATIHAKAASAAGAETNRIVGTATTFLDALKEFNIVRRAMLQHNTRFFFDDTVGSSVKYTFAADADLIHLVPTKTMETKDTYNATVLINNGVDKLAGKFLWMPETIYDPVSEQIINCDPFSIYDEKQETWEKSDGSILCIDSTKFVRLENLSISNEANYPWGLTKAYSAFSRYGQEFDPRGSVMLYENEDALTQDFVIPTQEQTSEVVNARKAKKRAK